MKMVAAFVTLFLVSTLDPAPARSQGVVFGIVEDPPVTPADLDAALTPHGDWVEMAPWGRVWRPRAEVVGEDFAPYLSNGRWLFGAYGWTFHSNYPWGWAAFHFGRWYFHPDQGWIWTRTGAAGGMTWGPAWVAWRTGGGFVGWLPQLPDGVTEAPHQYASLWSVVSLRHLQRPDLTQHLFPPERVAHARMAPPPGVGAPVVPFPSWRGYPRLRETLAVGNGAVFFPSSVLNGANAAGSWFGIGASVQGASSLGQDSGANQLWTGPGSSVFASPGFGSPTPGQQARGWTAVPMGSSGR